MTTTHEVALIPGDGVGHQVLPAGAAGLETVGRGHGIPMGPPAPGGS